MSWGDGRAVRREETGANWAHVCIAAGTRAVLATSTHGDRVVPKREIWQGETENGIGTPAACRAAEHPRLGTGPGHRPLNSPVSQPVFLSPAEIPLIVAAMARLISGVSSPARLRRSKSTWMRCMGSTYGLRSLMDRPST